jgi:splicing factor U2AF subunit
MTIAAEEGLVVIDIVTEIETDEEAETIETETEKEDVIATVETETTTRRERDLLLHTIPQSDAELLVGIKSPQRCPFLPLCSQLGYALHVNILLIWPILTAFISFVFGLQTPFMNNPAMLAMQPPGAMVQSTVPRQQRRLYVGNLPPNINPPELMGFLNMTMANTGVVKTPGNPVVDCIINHEKAYAFVEFRTPSEATAAMSFDGLVLQGQALRVRRPKDYVPMPDDDPNAAIGGMPLANLDIVSTNVEDTPNKIFIGGIPAHLNESEIKELLTLFGKLKSFNLVRDSVTSVSKGFAFCEYFDPSHTDPACKNLNGMKIGEKVLVVQRAAAGKRGEGLPSGDNFGDQSRGGTGEPLSRTCAMILNLSLPTANMFGELARQGLIPPPIEPTKVVVLMNVVDISTEWDDNYYDEVFQDMQGELTRFGKIVYVSVF